MVPFREIAPEYGGILQFIGLFPLILQIYYVIGAFYLRRRAAVRLFSVAQLAVGLTLYCALLDTTFTVPYAERKRSYPFFVEALYATPWLLVCAAVAVFTALAAVCVIRLRRYRRSRLSREAIKETVDMLPAGICFAKEDGTVLLKNLFMEELCHAIGSRSLNDALLFCEAVRAAGEQRGDTLFLSLPSGETIQFTQERITLDGKAYYLVVASDISEQYRITADLRAKNKKLLDIRLRMKTFGEETARLAMSEEILRARVTVHDEVGHVLLTGKYCLEHPDADGERFLQMARYTNRLLTREAEEPDDALTDPCADALDVAAAIGVAVTLTGELPADARQRELLGRAIRECAANTVKHAAGDSLRVTLSGSSQGLTAVLRGNGAAPDHPITESGGLLMLRRSVTQAGGTMTVTARPDVVLTLHFPPERSA